MAEENKNKIITIALAIVIIIAVITVLYVSIVKEENKETFSGETSEESDQEGEVILQFIYGDEITKYTLKDLEGFESFTGLGGYINAINVTTGPFELKGVKISTLIEENEIKSENYSISIKAMDNYTKIYDLSYINGDIPVYNETGVPIESGEVTMILNYKSDGEYLDSSIGPLRLAFVCEDGFTSSKIWIKQVEYMEIIES